MRKLYLIIGLGLCLKASLGYSDQKKLSTPATFTSPKTTSPQPITSPQIVASPQKPADDGHQEILSTIENLLTALQENQISQAYNTYMSEKFKQNTTMAEFKYFVEGYPGFSKNKNAFFGNIEKKPQNVSSVQGTLIATTAETLRVEFDFIKESGFWKIIGIKVFPAQEVPKVQPVQPVQPVQQVQPVQPVQTVQPVQPVQQPQQQPTVKIPQL